MTNPLNIIPLGYMGPPAQLNIRVDRAPTLRTMESVSVTVKEVNFIAPELDLSILYQDLQTIKAMLQEIHSKDHLELARLIGNELVGETYLRWDSRVRYYPTLTFLFLEPDNDFLKRKENSSPAEVIIQKKNQVKLRLEKHNLKDLDGEHIETLKADLQMKAQDLEGLNFEAGSLRCNYVNKGEVTWKTSIYCSHINEAHKVLDQLCKFVDTTYDREQLSATVCRRKSNGNEPQNMVVKLHKVVLFINGHPKAEEIYYKGI